MIKHVIFLGVMATSLLSTVQSSEPPFLETVTADSGEWARIINNTDKTLHCWIGAYQFRVVAHGNSRYYKLPDTSKQQWGCA